MGSNRQKKTWDLDSSGGNDTAAVMDKSPKANRERARCKRDPKYFYQNVIAPQVKDKRTGREYANTLGKIHDLMFDFMTFDMKGVKRYSCLQKHMPEAIITKEPDGSTSITYPERWIYFPKLDGPPSIYDGPDNPIAAMFYASERIWCGVVIRICGDGQTKSMLVPRGHLKSTIGNQCFNLWRIIRNPEDRTMIRSLTCQLARNFISDIKFQFEQNPRFRRLFKYLGPPEKRETMWNADMLGVLTKDKRGKEPTLWAMGMESEIVGGHFDGIMLDDVVGESNTSTPDQRSGARQRIQRLQAVRDPDTPMWDIGTRWEEDDVHADFINKDSEMAEDCSFMVGTVVDVDNRPVWPEKFTNKSIDRIRRGIPEDRIFFGQYYNQFAGTSARIFRAEWIKPYEGEPATVCDTRHLNVFIGIDTASGKPGQQGKLDYTAACVIGQMADRRQHFILDGFNEKLPAEKIPKVIVDLAVKWQRIVAGYGGTIVLGVEETAFTNFLRVALDYEQRLRGVDSLFPVEPLKHDNKSKPERIRILAMPSSEGVIMWPRHIYRPACGEIDDHGKLSYDGDPYDFIAVLREQFLKYPSLAHEDPLEGLAYAFQMAQPRDFFRLETAAAIASNDRSIYTREQSLRDHEERNGGDMSLGGFEGGGTLL